MNPELLEPADGGWICREGGFSIDPAAGVRHAVITHAHSDHARPGSAQYYCARPGEGVLRRRVGKSASILGVPYGEPFEIQGVRISFHPAGHVLGSAQVRVECGGQVWVVSGDYKTVADPTCAAFEPVPCQTFITESTFGLPLYRWPDPAVVFEEIHSWWRSNQESGLTTVLFAYSLGKAQRLLAGLDPAQGPILVHRSVLDFVEEYQAEGVEFPPLEVATPARIKALAGRAILISPQASLNALEPGPGTFATGSASGWMQSKKMRGQRGCGRGFVLSDHADWDGLIAAIRGTGARRILVTHGYRQAFARWLRESGWEAVAVAEGGARNPAPESDGVPDGEEE